MRILLVDDDRYFARECIETLLRNQYEVVFAPEAVSARRKIAEADYDLIVLDLMLPPSFGIEGLELLKLLRLRQENVPVIMITSKPSKTTNIVSEAMKLGANDFIDKKEPLFIERLLTSIKELETSSTTRCADKSHIVKSSNKEAELDKQEVAKPKDKQKISGTEYENIRGNQGGVLEPKPPEILQKAKWLLLHGRKHWKLIALVLLFFAVVATIKFIDWSSVLYGNNENKIQANVSQPIDLPVKTDKPMKIEKLGKPDATTQPSTLSHE